MMFRRVQQRAFSVKYDIMKPSQLSGDNLPQAPRSAFRKRPVKLTYDRNEYWQFRLPSEDAQLMGPFQKDDVFGKRQGVDYSPHIKAQVELDTRLLWLIGGLSIFAMMAQAKGMEEFSALRLNYRQANMGRFSADDFVEKK